VPPVAAIGAEYGTPFVPEVKLVVVMMSCGIVIASDRVTDLVCTGLDESATLNVRLAVPAVVGVPEIMPVAGARLRPAGSVPFVMDQV
jgi:hypothetical protein